MGLFGNNAPANAGPSLNLSATGAPAVSPFQNVGIGLPAAQPTAQGGFMGGMMGGMGMNQQQQQMMQNGQIAPPSETEIMLAMINSGYPIEKWITSTGFQNFVQMMSNMMELAIVEFFRNAKFLLDEETGTMTLDPTSLPSNLQTISSENVVNEFSNVVSSADQTKNMQMAQQQQILTFAQQSMMGGALSAAMANPGMMEKMGSGIGSLGRGLIGMK
jgi:hypothetical protein